MGGVSLRAMVAGDLGAVHDLVTRAERHDGLPMVTTRAEVREWFADPHAGPAPHPSPDIRAVVAVDGSTIVGYGRVDHRPSGARLERAMLIGVVDPGHRRRGIGSRILDWQLDRATDLLAGYRHDLPRYARTDQFEWVDDAIRLYERAGLEPVRWFEELLRPLADVPAPRSPHGVEIVGWDSGRAGQVLEVRNAAFADHWGSTPETASSWADRLVQHGVRLDLSLLAVAGDEVVGYSLNGHYPEDERVNSRREGWIDSLGVLPGWRGRGVASALIARSLHAFVTAGFTHAALGVDAQNPTGAAGLYRGLGFELAHRSVSHEREVPRA